MKSLVDRIRDRCDVDPLTDCWLWRQAVSAEGYPQFGVAELFGRRSMYVRRVVYAVACGPLHARQLVISTCENRLCCNPLHLRAMTAAQHAKTQARRDAQSRGRTHGLAVRRGRTYKLTGKAQEIRARLAAGERQIDLAREFGVHKTAISHLWRGVSHKTASPFGV